MRLVVNNTPREKRKGEDLGLLPASRETFDAKTGYRIIKIYSGDYHISTEPNEMMATILGSCVSACIRDPILKIGGMNHFLLPGDDMSILNDSAAARYGVFAMESLINGILKAGGVKSRLEVKVFGGGNVINNSTRIGSKNAAFVRNFLKQEGLRITSEDLEGDLPRRIHYYPDTGKVLMRKLNRKSDMRVVQDEQNYSKSLILQPLEGEVDLF